MVECLLVYLAWALSTCENTSNIVLRGEARARMDNEASTEGFRVSWRGYAASDAKDFSPKALPVLSRAAEEVSYLLDRDYPRDPTITFVGDRYQLTRRQRVALTRAVSGQRARERRLEKLVDDRRLQDGSVLIDGFNAIITLEVALSGSPVVIGQDGAVRDLAGLHGTYRIIDKTPRAITLILDALERCGATRASFLFDAPVSNSGNLCKLVRTLAAGRPLAVAAEVLGDVDHALAGRELVVSSDSVVLDRCASWVNLDATIVRELAEQQSGSVWLIDLLDGPSL